MGATGRGRRAAWLVVAGLWLLGACAEDQEEAQGTADVGQDAGDGGQDVAEDVADDVADATDDVADDATDDMAEDMAEEDAPPFTPIPLEDGVVLTPVMLEGSQAPPNPVSGAETPPEASMARFIRYTLGAPEADAQREGILVLVPGFLGGAGSFDRLARQVVTQSEGRFEVWAVDRRSNGLEDLRGMNAAEQARDPSVAQGYYFGGEEVDGARFAGLKTKGELGFMSEWGLQVHLEDLRAILALVPAELRERHLFLGGHSLGASVVQAYAAYEFEDGHKGHDDIAGLIVIDGTVGSSGLSPTEEEFLGGFNGGFMGQVQGLDQLRDGGAVVSGLPLVSPDVFLSVEVVAMRASKHTGNPQGFTPDPKVDAFFQLALQARPKGTHEAVLGFAFDQQFQPFAFLNTNMGNANGGRLTPYNSFFDPSVELLRPDDPQVRYGWTPFDGVDPAEVTDLQDVALAMYAGPSNFVEWYFPARLPLDLALLDGLTPIGPDDWRWGYGVRTSAASEVDAPVLAIGGQKGLTPSEASFEPWRATLAPMTRDGHTRDEEAGYKLILAPGHAHLDVVMSSNAVEGGNGILDPLLDWMSAIHQGQTLPAPPIP